jgi:branched-chain amino acid transport system permease protein
LALVLPPIINLGSSTYLLLIFSLIMIYSITTSGLDLMFGYSGMISLGQIAFFSIGAYTSTLLSMKLGFPVLLSIPCGGLAGMGVGALLALPISKLRAHFFALTTLCFNEIVYLIVSNTKDLTNGLIGITNIPRFRIGGYELSSRIEIYYFLLIVCILMVALKCNLVNSRIGRAFIAGKDNQDAARASSVNVRRYRVLAFALSTLFSGIAGALYAHLMGYINPDGFRYDQSVQAVVMLLLGGIASRNGPIIGAVCIVFLVEYLQVLGAYQTLAYGVVILIVVMFMPRGIVGTFSKEGIVNFKSRLTRMSGKWGKQNAEN